jgi:hypothetical protein
MTCVRRKVYDSLCSLDIAFYNSVPILGAFHCYHIIVLNNIRFYVPYVKYLSVYKNVL